MYIVCLTGRRSLLFEPRYFGMSTSGERDIHQNDSELEELCAFVDDTDRWINQTLTTLGWTRERVVKVSYSLL